MGRAQVKDSLRGLPQLSLMLDSEPGARLIARFSHAEVAAALRARLQSLREAVLADGLAILPDFTDEAFFADIALRVDQARQPSLRRVINATGILIHTNLGRAILAEPAIDAVRAAAALPSNLELDLDLGARGSRHDHVSGLICEVTGAQDAIVVNNCAAAILLCLTALARGREVVASRGELIEIGGGFRIPDVIVQSGAILREVGATNKTRISDYARAITGETAILLKSHTSNFRIVGFTAAPSRSELARLSRERGLVFLEDIGSGVLVDLAAHGLAGEPVVSDVLATGVDLVTFSGDKLLGGPQAGIIAGRRDLISELRSHPLARALRIDKLSLAALEATLRLYLPPHDPFRDVPVLAMLAQPITMIRQRALDLAACLSDTPDLHVTVKASQAYVGGGSVPQGALQSWVVGLRSTGRTVEELARRLRIGSPAVVGRLHDDRFWMDMRGLLAADLPDLAIAIRQAL